ncbi:hypothetical protein [Caballeronia zhejiangensis]|uniref:Uncharacterized protein n=1 Tax=Caballeronia zhejiangensis TaxID=871203 RepID=A0A656QSC9_9BURK|nr:hypothetical protein [Caballeronia zhejiangensis]KDR31769.1 hypothetical protein BG60_29015 [Caballeronia zhejiangensis]
MRNDEQRYDAPAASPSPHDWAGLWCAGGVIWARRVFVEAQSKPVPAVRLAFARDVLRRFEDVRELDDDEALDGSAV